jgi:hypothetical protein
MKERLIHTSLEITEGQLRALQGEALARVTQNKAKRMDRSAVLRDIIAWWIKKGAPAVPSTR